MTMSSDQILTPIPPSSSYKLKVCEKIKTTDGHAETSVSILELPDFGFNIRTASCTTGKTPYSDQLVYFLY